MALIRPFEVCTRDEVEFLMDLVREHVGHVRLSVQEDRHGRMRLLLEADTPELSRYLGFMLDRRRRSQPSGKSAGPPARLRRKAPPIP